jgi:hypothetical protein
MFPCDVAHRFSKNSPPMGVIDGARRANEQAVYGIQYMGNGLLGLCTLTALASPLTGHRKPFRDKLTYTYA